MNTIGGITEMLTLRNSFVIVTTPRNTERKKHQKEKKKTPGRKMYGENKDRHINMRMQIVGIFSVLSKLHSQI